MKIKILFCLLILSFAQSVYAEDAWIMWKYVQNESDNFKERWEIINGFDEYGLCLEISNTLRNDTINTLKKGFSEDADVFNIEGAIHLIRKKGEIISKIKFLCIPATFDPRISEIKKREDGK